MNWYERAYEELDAELENGTLSKDEYQRAIKDLQQEMREQGIKNNEFCSDSD